MKIGIIGQGFVGNAIYQKFKETYEVLTYDLDDSKCNSSLKTVVNECKYIFLCVPTPMGTFGKCDTSIVESVLENISNLAEDEKIIILKSTVPPGTTDTYNGIYTNLYIVFNPEFLTAVNAVEDFANQDRIILGGEEKITKSIGKIYKKLFPKTKIVYTTNEVAEMCKYVINTFLAVKVSFANEIYEFCKNTEIDYQEVINCVTLDKRIGNTHWQVPGPDGKYGFGLACLPKDINALIYEYGQYSLDPLMLKAAWEKNLKVRK